jgi:2,5-diamino-6-(ribosylamino)-4(3H)-pyrimidinone 5'-phosphate reductase
VFLNMVATIDGKIITGNRDEPVTDLGSAVDHTLLRRTEKAADAVMTGAQTLRATSAKWNPKAKRRFVVSRSGRVPADHAFFTGGEGYVVTAGSAMFPVPSGVKVVRAGNLTVDFRMALERIRSLGVQRLLVTGGSELNAQLLKDDLIDEIFLTVAPKVKLGADVPTIADGEALPRHALLHFELVEHHVIADEVFLRYRRRR